VQPEPYRGIVDLLKQAAQTCAALAALLTVEALLKPGPHPAGIPLVAYAFLATERYWFAAAVLAVLAGAWWAVRRICGDEPPAPRRQRVRAPALTPMLRRLSFGRSLMVAWLFGGLIALIVPTDTQLGPFAWAAAWLMGPNSRILSFVLGFAALMTPPILLALTPRQPRWPVFCGMQDVVKPVAHARRRGPHAR